MKILILLILFGTAITIAGTSEAIRPTQSANFEGSFDSAESFQNQRAHIQENFQDQIREANEFYQQDYEEEEADMLQFSQKLGDFIPDQTFTFRMGPNTKDEFFIWPAPQVESFRGMFHCQIYWKAEQANEEDEYVHLTIFDNNTPVRTFNRQRLGVFNQPHNLKDHKYYFRFENFNAPIDVYFSYELITAKKNNKAESNETEITKVTKSFMKVNRLLLQQQHQMNRLIELGDNHSVRIEKHLQQLWWRGITEALALIGSAITSLWLLKRLIYKQYQSLV